MSDIIDSANDQVALNEERSIKYAQLQANKLEVTPNGKCLFCGEDFEEGSQKRWCDKFCLSMWEQQRAFKR